MNKAELEVKGTRVLEFDTVGDISSFNLLGEVSFPQCETGPIT